MRWFRRARPHGAVFAAVAVVAALVTGTVIALLGALDAAADDGVRRGLATRSGADLALRATLPAAGDVEAQDAAMRAAISRALASLSTPPEVSRSAVAEAAVEVPGPLERLEALVLIDEGLQGHAELVDGRWAAGAGELTMQADAAAALALGVGDTVVVAGTPTLLTGTWQVTDALDPRWLGDERITDGRGRAAVPIVLGEVDVRALESERVHWTVAPDVTRVTAADLAAAQTGWPRLRSALRAEGVDPARLSTTGGFTDTAAELLAQVQGMRAIAPVVLLLVATAAVVTIAELARLAGASRAPELALLWSRGRSATANAVEAASLGAGAAVIGGVVGTFAAWASAAWWGRPSSVPLPTVSSTVAMLALVAAAGFWIGAARASRPHGADASGAGRASRLVAPGAAVLLTLAAATAVWQLQLYGSPITVQADGEASVDPVTAFAPALALVAIVFVGLTALPAMMRPFERLSRRSAATGMLTAHNVSRRLPRLTASIVVVGVATGTLVTAAAYQATWADGFERVSAFRSGADILATASGGGFRPQQLEVLDARPSVAAVFPLQHAQLQVRDGSAALVAAPPAALPTLVAPVREAIDADALAESLPVDAPGVVIPEGVEAVVLEADTRHLSADPVVTVLVLDSGGRLTRVTAEVSGSGDPATGRSITATSPVPASARDGHAQVLAVDVDLADDAVIADEARFVPTAWTDATGGSLTAFAERQWSPRGGEMVIVAPLPLSEGGFGAAPGVTNVRLMPDADDSAGLFRPPIAVTRSLADRYDLAIGDTFSFAVERSYARIDGEVVAIVPAVPSAGDADAVLIDLTVLQLDAVLTTEFPRAPNALWIQEAETDAAADVRRALPPNTALSYADDSAERAVVGSAALAVWGAGALCCLLALVTLAAVASAEHRARMPEIGLLRALGFRAREQASSRRGEWIAVLACAVIIGLLAGFVVGALTVPQLASAAIPGVDLGLGTPLRLDVTGLAIALAALVLVCAASVTWVSASVARDARIVRGPEGLR
ncbi:FtsX-like permease family protein [Microbacterium immunditiarum]|uniref:ABC3 transporter permease C-terminal domain-containing protein n=1 Tax=Microbacterium immunditiarum TaxID=337480 RepID=A0A7Y9KK09_9MICO|nr:FtsX-like permease family protein [Microbacterium immunditiarum]NYE20226.1 hypothetical protein [Microbacterium immunditiarum]